MYVGEKERVSERGRKRERSQLHHMLPFPGVFE